MTSPASGDRQIDAPFSLELSRKIYLGNYESETIGLRVDFMNFTPNDALKFMRGVLDPWVQERKAAIKANNRNNVKLESKPPPPKGPTCNRCGAPLKQTAEGKIEWQKGEKIGQFFPKNPDGTIHRCDR